MVNGAVTPSILARTSASGTTAWYLTDKLGSVRDIVNTSGTKLDHIVYDSFGNIVTETNATNGDRFKFAGMEYDATTGQYYDRARYYDEAIGRFMGQDPMGFQAGDADLYRYVGNGPTNATDPSGLLTVKVRAFRTFGFQRDWDNYRVVYIVSVTWDVPMINAFLVVAAFTLRTFEVRTCLPSTLSLNTRRTMSMYGVSSRSVFRALRRFRPFIGMTPLARQR